MRAFISGVAGQDGHFLSKLLIEKGYDVYGLVRRHAQPQPIPDGVRVIEGDVTDPSVIDTVNLVQPNEIYHLAAMSHVGESFKIPHATFQINAIGTMNMLEAARGLRCKFYQASTSEMFGSSPPLQNENTPFHPRSPYAVAKLAAHHLAIHYREAYGLFVCTGILFNHESPIRSEDFVTRKVCKAVARIKAGIQDRLVLGNLLAKRDWGHAKDFVNAMWLMMQQEKPDDYVVATGEQHAVHDLCEYAFDLVNLDWTDYVWEDKKFHRPSDVETLCGDSTKIRNIGWKPEYNFQSLIQEMLNAELSSVGLPHVGTGRSGFDSGGGEVGKLHDGREDVLFRESLRRIHQL